eukprot:CAMPEP_0170188622 /NCGR_PEP_ID=MMETSP0040_2-20121228/44787_1 /TAXON_ID=641309 /ORGANISM="Lotharella oceanica, Strain CCMP622" /LENGTH=175 /DNA_ID=CAMNT_0010435959 /DNA_START=645 /DNA_END=1172 /DNA_ORIENTATION=-
MECPTPIHAVVVGAIAIILQPGEHQLAPEVPHSSRLLEVLVDERLDVVEGIYFHLRVQATLQILDSDRELAHEHHAVRQTEAFYGPLGVELLSFPGEVTERRVVGVPRLAAVHFEELGDLRLGPNVGKVCATAVMLDRDLDRIPLDKISGRYFQLSFAFFDIVSIHIRDPMRVRI